MELKLYVYGHYRQFKPDDPVCTTRAMRSFACFNGFRDCLFRAQGGWYKLNMDGILVFKAHTLQDITFTDLFNILKD